jgi:hypothetical protein
LDYYLPLQLAVEVSAKNDPSTTLSSGRLIGKNGTLGAYEHGLSTQHLSKYEYLLHHKSVSEEYSNESLYHP